MRITNNGHAFDLPICVELEHVDALEAHGSAVGQNPIVNKIARRAWRTACAEPAAGRFLVYPSQRTAQTKIRALAEILSRLVQEE